MWPIATTVVLALALAGCAGSPQVDEGRRGASPGASLDDPYLWLEDVEGDKALAWARAHNARTEEELAGTEGFARLRDRLRAIYDSRDRIPHPTVLDEHVYNFWRDETNPQGLWRRTSLAEYRKAAPRWEVVIDVDALSRAESTTWVWHGAECLYPRYQRCLVRLSRGGSDAEIVREFDTQQKTWVVNGFTLPEAKVRVSWKDLDTIYVGTDFGEGSLTDSGYPRIAKEWKRGTPLAAARTVFEGRKTDVSVQAYREWDRGRARDWVVRMPSFYTSEVHLRTEDDSQTRLDKPDDADSDVWDDTLLLRLRTAWTVGDRTWPAGALLATPLARFRAGARDFTMLFEPTPNTSLEAYAGVKSAIVVVELEDVKSRLYLHTPKGGQWVRTKVEAPDVGSFGVRPYDEDKSDDFFFTETGFTTPTTLSLGHARTPGQRVILKQEPAFFDADEVDATQHFATSKDGTRVPYFQVSKRGLRLDGSAPTVLQGYGGFEVSLTPNYDPTAGTWIERGGVFVVANIRGGGEYGPAWHRAALKQNRQRAYDDFIAVAEDLVTRKVTSTAKLGTIGGSNGGLLMGVMLTQRPDLWGAIVCQVPLLDMRRYHTLLAGASWMEEYGNPDTAEEWAALATFSPYQNVKAGVRYPRTLFMTSTRDDRVHPGHARKMVARLLEHETDLLYYENIEGGHGGAANNEQRAHMNALAYTFFAKQLGLP